MFIFIKASMALLSANSECPQAVEEPVYTYQYFCEGADPGEVTREVWILNSSQSPGVVQTFEDGRLRQREVFSTAGVRTQLTRFRYDGLQDGDYIAQTIDSRGRMTRESEYQGSFSVRERVLLRRWIYDPSNGDLIERQFFHPDDDRRPWAREVLRDASFSPHRVEVVYNDDPGDVDGLEGIRVLTLEGQLISEFQASLSSEQQAQLVEEAESHQLNEESLRIAIIDSGVDYFFSPLREKIFINENENLDGVDEDGNGLVDDIAGAYTLYGRDLESVETNFLDLLEMPDSGFPFSHGTAVTDVAMRNTVNSSFLPFSGSHTNIDFLDWSKGEIQRLNIPFTTMSIAIPVGADNSAAKDDQLYITISDMIKETSNTFHFIAAFNEGTNFDETEDRVYPACFTNSNVVSVAALESSTIRTEDLPTYELADYSNRGVECTDIAAPGTNIQALSFGNLRQPVSGTSFSAPWVANIAVRISEEYENLAPQVIAQILLTTAYIPEDSPLAVKSGGIIFPERAFQMAELIASGSNFKAALKTSRRQVQAAGEMTDLDEIINLWRENGLIDKFKIQIDENLTQIDQKS